jgi:nucleoside-diphosphate-sugar epimerase
MRFAVLGARGYVGSHIATALRMRGDDVLSIHRGDDPFATDLGHVIYAIAVTNDARERAAEAVQANVVLLADVLRRARFESLLYLSSAQLYFGADRSSEEAAIRVDPRDTRDVYRISKAMGEALCFADPRPEVRVARLSAVYGEELSPRSFLAGVVRAATQRRHVELETSLDSERDFVHIADVASLLPEIAVRGRERLYNVASGRSTTNAEIAAALVAATGCTVSVIPNAPRSVYPPIDLQRARREFAFAPSTHVTRAIAALTKANEATT